jgi:hypothetical protein
MWPFGLDDNDIMGLLSFPREIADVQFDRLEIPANKKMNDHSVTCAGCGAPRVGYESNCRYCNRLVA